MTPDASDPLFMACVAVGMAGLLLACIAMDRRELPLGRVKMMPWTLLTILFSMGTVYSIAIAITDLKR